MQKLKENTIDTSKLKDYQRCPRYFFYRHVLGWDSESPNNHLVFGSAWHEAMEHILLNGYSQQSVMDAYDKFLAYYRKTFGPETDELFYPKTPDNAFVALCLYTGHSEYKRDLDHQEVLYTEIAGKVMIDETHSISYRMDSVILDKKTKKLFSREHKTGSSLFNWDIQWLLDLQPGTYSHVLYCLYPYENVSGIELNGTFFYKRKKEPVNATSFHRFPLHKNKEQMQMWLNRVRYLMWEIDREYAILEESTEDMPVLQAFPQRDTNCIYYMRLCPYHDYCTAWSNPLRRCDEPPIGFTIRYWNPLDQPAKKIMDFEKRENY